MRVAHAIIAPLRTCHDVVSPACSVLEVRQPRVLGPRGSSAPRARSSRFVRRDGSAGCGCSGGCGADGSRPRRCLAAISAASF